LLLIHGQDDPNPGTHAFQSERLFAALQGLGKRARLVLLPSERHSYDALESVLHVVAEQDMFLSKHVLGEADSTASVRERKRARI
jgi:dipeptidyl aminopeptidase/acylaminoacyl peptidase